MVVEGKGGCLAQPTFQKITKTPKNAKTPKGPPHAKNAVLGKNALKKKVGRGDSKTQKLVSKFPKKLGAKF